MITAITSLYLLSILGVEEDENSMVSIVGGVGGVSLGIATLIHMTVLIKTRNEQQRNSTTEDLPTEPRSTRGISAGDVEENAFIGALI